MTQLRGEPTASQEQTITRGFLSPVGPAELFIIAKAQNRSWGSFYCNGGLFSQSKQDPLGPLQAGIVITNTLSVLPPGLYNRTAQTAAAEGRAGARRCPDSNNRNQREAPGALQIRGAQPGAGFPRRQRRRDAAQRRPCSASPSPEAQLTEAGLPSGMETPSTVLNSFHSPPSLRSTINTCVSDGRTGRGSGSRSVGKVRKRCPNGGQRSR